MAEAPTKAHLVAVDILLCPICVGTPERELYQCRNGHIICHECINKCKICPQCKVNFSPSRANQARNLKVEEILDSIDVACTYETSGCQQYMKRHELESHRPVCNFRPLKLCEKLRIEDCQFKVSNSKEFHEHLIEAHPSVQTTKEIIQWRDVFNVAFTQGNFISLSFWTPSDVTDIEFLICLKTSKDANGNMFIHGVVAYLDDRPQIADDYWVSIEAYTFCKVDTAVKRHSVCTWGGSPLHFKSMEDVNGMPTFVIPISFLKARMNPGQDSKYDICFKYKCVKLEKKADDDTTKRKFPAEEDSDSPVAKAKRSSCVIV